MFLLNLFCVVEVFLCRAAYGMLFSSRAEARMSSTSGHVENTSVLADSSSVRIRSRHLHTQHYMASFQQVEMLT